MQLEPNKFPIDQQLETITKSLANNSCLLIKAETGAGKTTRLPPYLVSKTLGKILVLEPRRLAAKLSAERDRRRILRNPPIRIASYPKGITQQALQNTQHPQR